MRVAGIVVVCGLVAASCARTTDASPESSVESVDSVASVSIEALDGDGLDATLTLGLGADGTTAQLVIDWGDGTDTPPTNVIGEYVATHRYDDGGTYVVEVIVINDDGTETRTARSITIDAPVESTTSTSTTSTTSTSTSSTTTSTTTTTTPPTTTTTTTTTSTTTAPPPPTTTTTTTTTTLPPEPIVIDLTNADDGGTYRNDTSSLPFKVLQSTYWYAGNLHARAAVGVAGSAELTSEAWITTDFVAPYSDATIRADISWKGYLLTLASFGSGTGVEVEFGVYEVDGGAQGARIAGEKVLDEEILAEAIQSISNVTYQDTVSRAYDLRLEPGRTYRVRLDLRCQARAAFALSATVCNFGTNDPTDTGDYARWRNVTATFQPGS